MEKKIIVRKQIGIDPKIHARLSRHVFKTYKSTYGNISKTVERYIKEGIRNDNEKERG